MTGRLPFDEMHYSGPSGILRMAASQTPHINSADFTQATGRKILPDWLTPPRATVKPEYSL